MKLLPASRADRLMLGILLPLALLAALVTRLFLPAEQKGDWLRQPSTFFNVGYGTKAAYLVLQRLDYRVQRLRRPISRQNLTGLSGLLILRPSAGLTDDETNVLLRWVHAGHRLVMAPGDPILQSQPGDYFTDWFEIEQRDVPTEEMDKTVAAAVRAAVQDDTSPGFDAAESLCEGAGRLVAGAGGRFSKGDVKQDELAGQRAKAFWSDELGIVALRMKHGAGEIVALADTYPLSNAGISAADNGVFVANLAHWLAGPGGGTIAFDEYHHNFMERDLSWLAMAKLLLAGPWRWAVLQAVLVALLALYAAGVRFGSPRDLVRRRRRQHREFAESAGRLLDEAGGAPLAYRTILHQYRDRLCRLVHRPAGVDDRQLIDAVRSAGGGDLRGVLGRAQCDGDGQPTRQQLLQMTQELGRAVEALEHGP